MFEKRAGIIEERADDADDLYEGVEKREETIQLVVFRLAQEWYGVDIRKVKEIVRLNRVTYLPSSPQHIAGIVSLRGNILSVTDLKVLLNLSSELPAEKARIIAIESGILETGLIADEVIGSIELPLRVVGPVIPTIPDGGAKYLEGLCKVDNKLIGVLSVEKVLEVQGNGT
jgi:purine-binding chemotaxis protein CheW